MENYELLGTIGEGTYGVVLKARHKETGQIVAIKKFKESDEAEEVRKTALREVRILKQLRHDNIVGLLEVFRRKRKLYLVFEFVESTLLQELERRPEGLDPLDTKKVMWQLVRGIDYLHQHQVIHRDIKPENLLLDSRGQLKVTDLGISQELVDGVCNSTSGTRPYMAPEVFMSGHRHTSVADIYSMGITVFQFLVGKRPYSPTPPNMKAIVRMATFVPPDRYKDLRQIRRILINAQERKAPSTDFAYSRHLTRFSPEAMDFVSCCLICNPKYRLGAFGVSELMAHPWFAGVDWEAMRKQEVRAGGGRRGAALRAPAPRGASAPLPTAAGLTYAHAHTHTTSTRAGASAAAARRAPRQLQHLAGGPARHDAGGGQAGERARDPARQPAQVCGLRLQAVRAGPAQRARGAPARARRHAQQGRGGRGDQRGRGGRGCGGAACSRGRRGRGRGGAAQGQGEGAAAARQEGSGSGCSSGGSGGRRQRHRACACACAGSC
jgi:cyclin-dependent kinase-like